MAKAVRRMSDKDDPLVSPYLLKPLRSIEQARTDIHRHVQAHKPSAKIIQFPKHVSAHPEPPANRNHEHRENFPSATLLRISPPGSHSEHNKPIGFIGSTEPLSGGPVMSDREAELTRKLADTFLVKPPPRSGFSVSNTRSLAGATPFWLAAMAADVDMLRLLAANGADLRMATTNEPRFPGFGGLSTVHRDTTPLMVAAGVGRNLAESTVTNRRALGAVQFIWELGGDINAANQVGNTALHGAAHVRSEALVQFLVDKGATVTVENEGGDTPLIVAERYAQPGAATIIARTSTGDLLRELGGR